MKSYLEVPYVLFIPFLMRAGQGMVKLEELCGCRCVTIQKSSFGADPKADSRVWSFLPEAKLLITQQPPTRLQQEDTDFCEVLWQTPLSTFATQVEAKPQAAEKEPQTLLCKDKNCAKQMCWVIKGRGTQKRQET